MAVDVNPRQFFGNEKMLPWSYKNVRTSTRDNSPSLQYEKTWQGFGWLMVALVIFLSLAPLPPQPTSFLEWDKAQHIAAYGCLMAWFGMCFSRTWRWPAFLVGLGIVLEILQGLEGTRTFDFFDMLANAIGVSLGLGLLKTPLRLMLSTVDGLLARCNAHQA